MKKQIIAYIAVFLLTLYCFFMYHDEIIAMMLAAEVVYFALSLVWLQYLAKKISVSLGPVIPIAEKNREIPLEIHVKNKSRIPIVHVKVQLQIENLFTGEKQRIKVSGAAGSKSIEKIQVVIKAKSCGHIQISVRRCWIYDPLFILKKKKSIKEIQRISILPKCHLLPVEVTRKTREFIADAEEYSDRESGDDPAEIYQIREYRELDSMHDIHWKLSAKADELLVKEHGRPLGCVVLIWLNLEVKKKAKYMSSVVLEAVASLSLSLLEAECVHMVAWYEVENQQIKKKRISKEAHIYELMNQLLFVTSYQESVQYQFEEAFRGSLFSTVIEFREDGTVLIDKEEKMSISLQDGEQNWDTMSFIV